MLVAVLFLLSLGGVLLAVAVLALRRQIRASRLAMTPAAALPDWTAGDAEMAPIVSVPSLRGDTLTIGGFTRDPRFVLLLFVDARSSLCRAVIADAAWLARERGVRLLVVGDDAYADYAEVMQRTGLEQEDFILCHALHEDFMIGPVPSAALLDAAGHLVARGTVQQREHLEVLLASIRAGKESTISLPLLGSR